MSYIINLTNGTFLTSVPDGQIDTSIAGLSLIGKSYDGFGTAFNTDLVQMTENFSNSTPPANPLTGQFWYDSVNKVIKIYNGSLFKTISVSTASATAPTNPTIGDEWFDTINQQLKVWNGTTWILIGPSNPAGSGLNGVVTSSVVQNSSTYYFADLYADNRLVGKVASDDLIEPGIPGFGNVRPGINFSISPSADIVLAGLYNVEEITIGNNDQLTLNVDASNNGIILSTFNDLILGSQNQNIIIISNAGVIPALNNTYSLGNTTNMFSNIYADNIYGNVTVRAAGSQNEVQTNNAGTLAGSNIFATGSVVQINSTVDINGTLNTTGQIIAQNYIISNISGTAFQFGTSSVNEQGVSIIWDNTPGLGETDFINYKGGGVGGFNFYNLADGITPVGASPIAEIGSDGNFIAESFQIFGQSVLSTTNQTGTGVLVLNTNPTFLGTVVADQINAGRLQLNNSAPTNHILLGNGTDYVDSATFPYSSLSGVPTLTIFYQTTESAGVGLPQRSRLNFNGPLTINDDAGNDSTDIGFATSGVAAGSYTLTNLSVDAFGRITSASSGTVPVSSATLNDVTGSRAFGTTFTNSSGKWMTVTGYGVTGGSSVGSVEAFVDGISVFANTATGTISNGVCGFSFSVPAGATYSVFANTRTNNQGNAVTGIGKWIENVIT